MDIHRKVVGSLQKDTREQREKIASDEYHIEKKDKEDQKKR